MSTSTETNTSLSSIVESISILVTAGFVVSVIYDWGFLRSLGLDLKRVPTSISDHIRTGLLWFPPLIGMAIAHFAIEFQFQRIEKGLTEEEIVSSAKNPKKMRKFREGPYKFFAQTGFLIAILSLMFGDIYASALPFALVMVWGTFANWCYSAPLIRLRRSQATQGAFVLIPAIMILAYFNGYSDASAAAYKERMGIEISLASNRPVVEGTFLRTIEAGILYLSEDTHVEFVPWNEIRSYRIADEYHPYLGVMCEWFNICKPARALKRTTSNSSLKADVPDGAPP